MTQIYAPGMRIQVRDEEWVVRRADYNADRKYILSVTGVSDFVRGQEAAFLSDLEEIRVIDPADTQFVVDRSPMFRKSRLYIESLLRRRTPPGNVLRIGHKAAMNVIDFQLEPAQRALARPRQRILLADGVGLGKTLEAGVLMSELIARGKGKRILVVALKSMMLQLQKELWTRFTIPLKRLDSRGIQRIRANIPTNHNPFYYFDKVIISIDTLKMDREYRTLLEKTRWDIIVIDEAHNVARRGKTQAQRSRLAELLSKRSDTLILLSATPHDGRPQSFASLMNMLEPTAIANEEDYRREDIQGMVFRRFKKDVQDQVSAHFKERVICRETCEASGLEESFYDFFETLDLTWIDRARGETMLFKTLLEKSVFSSPVACEKTAQTRINKLKKEGGSESASDIRVLETLIDHLKRITPEHFSRYRLLVRLLQSPEYGWNRERPDDRLVIFTERIETMRFLAKRLKEDLRLSDGQLSCLYGGMSDVDQQQAVDEFGATDSPVRLLIASDVASEGINLHFLCHRLIHFDIPWSLMVFQQRNGRIDRYGQEKTPDIRYLVTKAKNERIHGDMRILEILIDKEEQAEKNIGDPASLLGRYDVEEEERTVARVFEKSLSVNAFERLLSAPENPFLAMMNAGWNLPDEAAKATNVEKADPVTLFDETSYLKTLLETISNRETIPLEAPRVDVMEIRMSESMKRSLEPQIPEEAFPSDDWLRLTTDKKALMREIKESRQKAQDTWPRSHYLWPLHPIIDWMNDKAGLFFGRQEAPVLFVPFAEKRTAVFIISGLIPNRQSEPVIDRWFVIRFVEDNPAEFLSPEDFLRSDVFKGALPNQASRNAEVSDWAAKLLPTAIGLAKEKMKAEQEEFEETMTPKLDEEIAKLKELRKKHDDLLQSYDRSDGRNAQRYEIEKRRIDEIFNEFQHWLVNTMKLEKDNPYIRVVALLLSE